MKITICGSMATEVLVDGMIVTSEDLVGMGYKVILPKALVTADYSNMTEEEIVKDKNYYMWEHIKKIEQADSILVLNPKKNGVENYIGGNTLVEMGVALYLKKKIFILNKPNKEQSYYSEILGMKPIVLKGDLKRISDYV